MSTKHTLANGYILQIPSFSFDEKDEFSIIFGTAAASMNIRNVEDKGQIFLALLGSKEISNFVKPRIFKCLYDGMLITADDLNKDHKGIQKVYLEIKMKLVEELGSLFFGLQELELKNQPSSAEAK